MKIHKKFNHSLPGVHYWGERPNIKIRINFGNLAPGESLPSDEPHYHETRTTYFCVLEGALIMEVERETVTVTQDKMLEVAPKEVYRTVGVGDAGCKWVVIGDHNEADKVVV